MIFTDITSLYTPRVQENTTLAQSAVRQIKGTVDVSKGTALYDMLVRPIGVLFSLTEENIARARNAGSLLRISQRPDLADTTMVDELLSNYRTTRKAGVKAAGRVTIALSSSKVTAIPRGAALASGTQRFFTTDSFIAVPSVDQVSSATDRVIRSIGGGQYGFDVDVEAESEGSEYSLVSGDILVLDSPPANYVSAWAAEDFVQGASAETTTDLIARLPESLANRTPGNNLNIISLMKEHNSNVKEVSIVGYGMPEMARDKENLFGISYGGKIDVYAQTVASPLLERRTKEAVLVNKATGRWQMFFSKDEYAGAYKIEAVIPTDRTALDGSLAIVSEVRAVDSSGSVPHVIGAIEQAAFSRFQTVTIEFIDPFTDTSSMTNMVSKRDYYVDLYVMPGIADLQDNLFDDPSLGNPRYDDIVRAPVPCFVSVSCTVRLKSGDSLPSGPRQAIADRINGLGFRTKLSTAYVIDALQGLLQRESYVAQPVDMLGELIHPRTGESVVYRSGTELLIPDDKENCISENTVMFFCDAASVTIYQEAF